MSALVLLAVAIALDALSVAGMAMVIGVRLRGETRKRELAQCRRAIVAVLADPASDRIEVRRVLEQADRLGALAPLVLDASALVRGETRSAVLVRFEREGAVQSLRRALHRGRPHHRVRAAEALGVFDAPSAVCALREAWTDRYEDVRLAAMRASIEQGDAPAFREVLDAALTAADSRRGRALALLTRAAASGGGEALQTAVRADLPLRVRQSVIAGLGARRDPHCVATLSALARHGDPEVRGAAVCALAATGAEPAFAAVHDALGDPAWQVRMRAASAAGALRLSAARPVLQALQQDTNWWVRLRATEALDGLAPGQAAS